MKKSKKVASSYLSDDIIFGEIIPRLFDVKSLLKFRCVSKSWLSFISSKKFAKTHLQKSVNNLVSIQLGFNWHKFAINYCQVGSLFSDLQSINVVNAQLDDCFIHYHFASHVIGCSNGLCCVLVDDLHFILFNPFTRKSYVLPHVFNKDICGCRIQRFGNDHVCEARELSRNISVQMDGFGYDETNDDYIVFAFFKIKRAGRLVLDSVLRIYSLKANAWKTVEHSMIRHIATYTTGILNSWLHWDTYNTGVLLNGRLHWPARWTDGELHVVKPFSFDLGTRAFGLVEGPSSFTNKRLYQAIGVVQGCLCMLCDDPKDGTEVWVMKEYGVKVSWYKMVTIPYLGIDSHRPHQTFKVIYVSEDGNFLLLQESSFFIYNRITKAVRRAIKGPEVYMINGVGLCVESLVSPLPHGEGEELN